MTWKVTPDDQEMYNRIDGSSPSDFRHPPSMVNSAGKRFPDSGQEKLSILFYSAGGWGTTNSSMRPTKQL